MVPCLSGFGMPVWNQPPPCPFGLWKPSSLLTGDSFSSPGCILCTRPPVGAHFNSTLSSLTLNLFTLIPLSCLVSRSALAEGVNPDFSGPHSPSLSPLLPLLLLELGLSNHGFTDLVTPSTH